jgi:hypothetical protein
LICCFLALDLALAFSLIARALYLARAFSLSLSLSLSLSHPGGPGYLVFDAREMITISPHIAPHDQSTPPPASAPTLNVGRTFFVCKVRSFKQKAVSRTSSIHVRGTS